MHYNALNNYSISCGDWRSVWENSRPVYLHRVYYTPCVVCSLDHHWWIGKPHRHAWKASLCGFLAFFVYFSSTAGRFQLISRFWCLVFTSESVDFFFSSTSNLEVLNPLQWMKPFGCIFSCSSFDVFSAQTAYLELGIPISYSFIIATVDSSYTWSHHVTLCDAFMS